MSGGGGGASELKKGPWTAAEDAILAEHVRIHGVGNWNAVQKSTGLSRCGKSCRLRWTNHLRPHLKKGSFSPDEELLILRLHAQLGNKWSRMATQLPGRTDNEIKNYWNTRIKRRRREGTPLYTPEIQPPTTPALTPALLNHKTHFTAAPLSLFRADGLSFEFPLSPASPHTPPPFPLYRHNQQQHLVRYNSGNFDLNPLPLLTISANTELPSTQLFTDPFTSGGDSGSGLLDSLLQEAKGIGEQESGGKNVKLASLGVGGCSNVAGASQWPVLKPLCLEVRSSCSPLISSDVPPLILPAGIKMKTEQAEEIDLLHDDISMLLHRTPGPAMPPTPVVRESYNGDSKEMSNRQSAVITDDSIRLEMQQLASSLSVAPVDDDWNFESCTWNNMPGFC